MNESLQEKAHTHRQGAHTLSSSQREVLVQKEVSGPDPGPGEDPDLQ